jgi:hypothetical protein
MLAAIGFVLILVALRRLRRTPKSELHLHIHVYMLPPPRRDEPPEPPPDILRELDRVVRDHGRIDRKVKT